MWFLHVLIQYSEIVLTSRYAMPQSRGRASTRACTCRRDRELVWRAGASICHCGFTVCSKDGPGQPRAREDYRVSTCTHTVPQERPVSSPSADLVQAVLFASAMLGSDNRHCTRVLYIFGHRGFSATRNQSQRQSLIWDDMSNEWWWVFSEEEMSKIFNSLQNVYVHMLNRHKI